MESNLDIIKRYNEWLWDLTRQDINVEEFSILVATDLDIDIDGMPKLDALGVAVDAASNYIQKLNEDELKQLEIFTKGLMDRVDDSEDALELVKGITTQRLNYTELDIEVYSFNKLIEVYVDLVELLKKAMREDNEKTSKS